MPLRRIRPATAATVFALTLTLPGGAQDAPPPSEEMAPAATGNTPQFRMSYPVRDAVSGQTFTEQPPAPSADVPTAVSDADLTAGLALPDPEPMPEAAPATSEAVADAVFETVGSAEGVTEELPEPVPFRSGSGPFRYSFYVTEGYNSNVNALQNGGVQSMYTEFGASVGYKFGTSRVEIDLGLSAGATYYYNNAGLQNNGIFPDGQFIAGIDYAVSDQLDIFLESSTALMSQPDFAIVGTSNTYQGDYLISGTTLGASYRWLPKFKTVTSYNPVFWYYAEPIGDNFSRLEQTISQQFIFLWKPTTSLVAEYRFDTRNYWYIDNYNSIGNFALLGFNHSLNPRSELVFRAGAEQRLNEIPNTGGTYSYIGPFGELSFNYSLREATMLGLRSRYGTVASGLGGYNQDQQFLAGITLQHAIGRRLKANAYVNYQNNFYDQPNGTVPDFQSNVLNAGFGASFDINRVWSLNAGYGYTGLISTDDRQQGSYNQNLIFLGTAFSF